MVSTHGRVSPAHALASIPLWLAPVLVCTPLAGSAAHGASTTLVVNEIQTGSSASAADEFVEIVSIASGPIDLTGYRLVYRSATSDSDTVMVRFTDGPILPPGGVIVYGGVEYTGPTDGAFSGSLASTAGGVAIRDPDGKIVDAVAYGEADNGFAETRPTVAPEKDHSIHRIPCGHDTDDNSRNLQELLVPTPRVTCSGIRAPSVSEASFSPPGVNPGAEATLSVRVLEGTFAIASVKADLSALGGSASAALSRTGFGGWALAVDVGSGTAPGPATARVTATDTAGGTGYATARLYVKNPVPASVLIHEVQTAGETADEEFIELYNPTAASVDITGYRLVYRSPTSDEDSVLLSFGSVTLKPHGYFLLGTAEFLGPKDATVRAALSGTGGGLGLRDTTGALVDSAGYGNAANAFVETQPAPAPKAGESIERAPVGVDTNDNAADFTVLSVPTPTPAVNKPVVMSVTFDPPSTPPGGTSRITATVAPGDVPVTDVAADLIRVGGDIAQPLAHGPGDTWSANITVDPLTTIGQKKITVWAKDGLGLTASGIGTLTVSDTKPVPPIKVNEVKTGGNTSGSDEFIEIYNPGATTADLGGWSLVYRSEKGTSDTVLHRFTGKAIAAHGYLLLAGDGYVGDRDGSLLSTLSANAGSVGLRDPLGTLVDSVGYGTAANALVETAPAPAPAPGQSIGRRTEGLDTDNNASDFRIETAPSPRTGGSLLLRPGDANRDGLVTPGDAILTLRVASGLMAGNTVTFASANADVWPAAKDAQITIEDAVRILRAATGREAL